MLALELELDGEKYTPTGLSRGRETVSTHPFERLFLGGLPSEYVYFRSEFADSRKGDFICWFTKCNPSIWDYEVLNLLERPYSLG